MSKKPSSEFKPSELLTITPELEGASEPHAEATGSIGSGDLSMPSVSSLLERKKMGQGLPPIESTGQIRLPPGLEYTQKADQSSPTPVRAQGPTDRALPVELTLEGQSAPIELASDETRSEIQAPSRLPFDVPDEPTQLPPSPIGRLVQSGAQSSHQTKDVQKPLEVRRAQRRMTGKKRLPDLKQMPAEQATQDAHSLGRALKPLFAQGAYSALLLSQQNNALHASCAIAAQERAPLWNGLRWLHGIASDVWSHLGRSGYISIAPVAAGGVQVGSISNGRRILRAALGLKQNEWLSLVQIDGTDAGTGVLAVISNQSVEKLLPNMCKILKPGTESNLKVAA